jgi:VanZ family protein
MRNIFFKLPEPEHQRFSWLLVLFGSIIIFLTIPLACFIQGHFEVWFGARGYSVAAAIMAVFLVVVVSTYIFRRRKRRIARRLGWLVLLLLASVWVMRNQLQTPAEAIHFFEYGILSFLLFRAWSHHVRDRLIYPIATLSLMMIASLDEFFQWMMPGRFWDFRDIRLNMMAGLFVQGIIALVINPSGIDPSVQRRSVRIFCRMAWAALLFLGAAISNTPARVDIYTTRIPFMRFLSNNESVMAEYGYRHHDPAIGRFYSRFLMSELQRLDQVRGAEAGETIRRYAFLADYREFIRIFTSSVDPLLHEMRVHLHRRDHYVSTADQYKEKDPERFVLHMTVAFRENQLLEKYFPNALIASGSVWDNELLARVEAAANPAVSYVSPVSDHLVTAATELELWVALAFIGLLVGYGYLRYGREPVPQVG